jgi:cytochrome c oxidase assembly factor CtaG
MSSIFAHLTAAGLARRTMRMRNWLPRLRPYLALAGAVLALAVLLPPIGSLARHYVYVQALQFAVLGTAVPAMVVLGAPWRLAGDVTGRLATARSHRTGTARAWAVLIGFIAVAVLWRLPVAVNALVRYPALTVAEAASLTVAGCALWLELVESPPFLPTITRPLRAAFAALPMWVIWASAYIMAFSHTVWFTAFAHRAALSIAADQQIAAGLLWAIPGLCFVPVVYVSLIGWLRDTSDPDHELRRVPTADEAAAPPIPRPPRGWRLSR